jgi:protein-disulfide isomerase
MKERLMQKTMIGCAVFFMLAFITGLVSRECRAEEASIPSFGEGPVNVKLYTDYFCLPCNEMEPAIEPVLADLVRTKTIRIMFIDTPFHRYSSLYARYFLYAVHENKTWEHVLFVRKSLIEAARQKIYDVQKLEAFLTEKKIRFKPYDVKPVFNAMSGYLKQDAIDRTPTCLVETGGKTDKYSGKPDIANALDTLRQAKPAK